MAFEDIPFPDGGLPTKKFTRTPELKGAPVSEDEKKRAHEDIFGWADRVGLANLVKDFALIAKVYAREDLSNPAVNTFAAGEIVRHTLLHLRKEMEERGIDLSLSRWDADVRQG